MTPSSAEETVTIVDDAGRKKVQRVVYSVVDVRGERIFVTAEGLQYIHDSLRRKRQVGFIAELERLLPALSHPDIVILDPDSPEDTRVYYKEFYDRQQRRQRLMAVIVKARGGIRFVYNVHPQQSGRAKGSRRIPPPEIWYISAQRKPREFGL